MAELSLRSIWSNSDIVSITCSLCGVEFGMTADMNQRRRNDRRNFYCPNGHSQAYLTSEKDREIESLKKQVSTAQSEAARERNRREFAERATQGARISAGKALAAKRRLEHRVNCGVCPHCNRTFKQLAAHMKSKHQK
jgi:hypothetical protein